MKKWILLILALCCTSAKDNSSSDSTSANQVAPVVATKDQAERTLSIIKPDAVANKHIGEIISRFENNGLTVAAIKMQKLDKATAGEFYAVHKDRPFYPGLVDFMSSNPVVIMVLEGDNAVVKNREIMGATNPNDATTGTIRKDFAKSVSENAVHGSDSIENAEIEIRFFFKPEEIYSR